MADISLDEAIAKVAGASVKIAETAVEIMKEEVPVRTGRLRDSIRWEWDGNAIFVGPTAVSDDGFEYARSIEYGRRAVFPIRAKALHWNDWPSGKDVFSQWSSAVPPNDFVGRTKARLENMNFDL